MLLPVPALSPFSSARHQSGAIFDRTGLSAAWRFDESSAGVGAVTRNDSQGSSHLVDHGNTPSVAGVRGNAARLTPASSQYFSTAHNSGLSCDTALTVAFWVRRTAAMSGFTILCGKYNDSAYPNSSFAIYAATATAISALVVVGGTPALHGSNVELTLNTWHLLTMTKALGSTPFFLQRDDGVPITGSVAGTPNAGTVDWMFGLHPNTGGYSPVDLDMAVFFKRVLSAAEITAYFNGGAGIVLP